MAIGSDRTGLRAGPVRTPHHQYRHGAPSGPGHLGGCRPHNTAYRLCFKYLKNSPSVDRISVVSVANVFRYVSIVFRNW